MATALPPPSKPLPPPPPSTSARPTSLPSRADTISSRTFKVSSGIKSDPQKTVIYGPGGSGKSSLAAALATLGVKPFFVDIGDGTADLNVDRAGGKEDPIDRWEDLRGVLRSKSLFHGYGAVILDDLTRAEEMAGDWVVRNVPHEKKDKRVNGLEDYGFGKGLGHVYDEFIKIFGDLDSLVRDGLHVVCIAHECAERVPNPGGDDWLQWQPRLQSPKSGKDSIRHRVKEWCDHLLFIGYDTSVGEDGKGKGAGTRTIHTAEMPAWLAKSRRTAESVNYEKGSCEIWNLILKGK